MEKEFGIPESDINFVNLTYDVKDYLQTLENQMEVSKQRSILE